MDSLNNITISELDKMSLTHLKRLGLTLGIEITETTPTRSKLLDEIKECLIAQGKISPDTNSDERDEEDTISYTETTPDHNQECSGLSEELKFKIELAKIESHERMQTKIELAKIELAKIEAESKKCIELAKLQSTSVIRDNINIDLTKYKKHVPEFNETHVEEFFLLFEKAADDYKFPIEKKALLLRSALNKGRAMDVILSLKAEEDNEYDVIKDKVLRAYEMVPEKYRKLFREGKKDNDQSHVDFLRVKEKQLDRWLRSRNVSDDFEKFKNIVLLEEFLNCVRLDIRTHIADRGVDNAQTAARLADDYALIHPTVKTYQNEKFKYPVKQSSNEHHRQTFSHNNKPSMNTYNTKKPNEAHVNTKPYCSHCKKDGHTKQNCWTLNKKANKTKQEFAGCCVVKPMMTNIDTNTYVERPQNTTKTAKKNSKDSKLNSTCLEKKTTARAKKHFENNYNSQESASRESTPTESTNQDSSSHRLSQRMAISRRQKSVVYENSLLNSNQSLQANPAHSLASNSSTSGSDSKQFNKKDPENSNLKDFMPFISEGFVSLPNDILSKKPIRILRDTGASLSVILQGTIPLSEQTYTGQNVLLRGVEMGNMEVPLHRIQLQSELISGTVTVGVQPALPFEGISLLIGNDLAGGRVKPEPIMTHDPNMNDKPAEDADLYPVCAYTRGMSKKNVESNEIIIRPPRERPEVDLSATFFARLSEGSSLETNENSMSPRQLLIHEQQNDVELAKLREEAVMAAESENIAECYYLKDDILMRKWKPREATRDNNWEDTHQIMVPARYRNDILRIAHDLPFAGHMGVNKTYHRVLPYFYWPGLRKDVASYCKSCHTCQMVGKPNQTIPVAPLQPIPAFSEPFSNIIIDCVGPLPKTRAGHQYLFTIMCSATRFPEAIPLRKITADKIVDSLIGFFTRYGLPKTVQSDQGTNFTSKLFKQVLKRLGVQHNMSSAYHPESQGALERFHQTLKSMLKTYCLENEKDWDKGVPLVLFAAREAVQESLGFSPFELIFGHTVRGPLKLLQETWTSSTETFGLLSYVDSFKNRLFNAFDCVRKHLTQSQHAMKTWYDKKARIRSFSPGDQVLVFLPIPGQPLNAKFSGPYEVEAKISNVNYLIKTPGRRREKRLCHINMLKPYFTREKVTPQSKPLTFPMTPIAQIPSDLHKIDHKFAECKLQNSNTLKNFDCKISHLSVNEKEQVKQLIHDFPQLFSDVPRQTHLIEHDIVVVEDCKPIKQHPYRANPIQLQHIRQEVDYMLKHDIIEPSASDWSSPCVLVPKADSSFRFCTDYRKVNAVTKTDSYPIPRIDDLIDKIGDAQFVTKIDLLSAYFQIPLTPRAQEISSFATPDGLFKYKVMPFGLKNAPATFQRLINSIVQDIFQCNAYLDDIVIYSNDYSTHVKQLRHLFTKLDNANLTVNLAKSQFGHATIEYLGHIVGGGKIKPVDAKIAAIQNVPIPQTRKQVRSFLGMAGYYRKFCANFSTIACPLTDLLKKNSKFKWSEECNKAFEQLKLILSHAPVLVTPKFGKPFKIAVDACDTGMGAVLFQEDDDKIEHPICYHSQKFNPHEKNYSTIEKELLGIILALKHFDFYVNGSQYPIEIFTDHNPLTFLTRVTQNQRLLRWSLFLQSYDLNIKHIKGKENVIADALSRI